MKAIIEINSCMECPHLKCKPVYTADSFENVENLICNKANKKIAQRETFDKIEIPEWCPIKFELTQVGMTPIQLIMILLFVSPFTVAIMMAWMYLFKIA